MEENRKDLMQETEDRTVQVDIRSGSRVVDEMMSDVFVFVLVSWLVFISAFVDYGDGAGLTLGVLKLSLVGMFFMGARERMKVDSVWGNTNMCFVFLFGVFGGVTDILGSLGITLNPIIMSIPNIYLGALMVVCIGALRKNPWSFFVMWIFAAIGVLALGLAGIGVMPGFLTLVGKVLLGGVAVIGNWALIVLIHGYTGTGKKLSLGKPWFTE